MKVLVTGAGGYVGTSLCSQLLEFGYRVRAVDNFHKGQCDALITYCQNDDFEFLFGDVTNRDDVKKMVKGVDAIIHLAGIVGFPACAKNPSLSYSVNVQGTENIVMYRERDVPIFFASTGSVYGKISDTCYENSPANPLSAYGLHKLAAEKILLSAENTSVYRFATAFGVSPCMRVDLLVNDLVYQAYSNKYIVIFQADFKRSFIDVKEMGLSFIYGLQRLGGSDKGRLFNVGCPANNMSKRELAELIRDRTGSIVIYEDIAEDIDKKSCEVDFSRFENAVGWLPEITVSQGIDRLLKTCDLLQMRSPYQ